MDPFTIAALGGAAASGISGIMGAGAARQAGQAQSQAAMMSAIIQAQQAEAARQQQERMFERAVAMQQEAVQRAEPFRLGGVAATNRMQELYGIGGNQAAAGYGSYAQPFSMADYQADPGYDFRFREGQRALESSAAARGGLLSGGTGKALARYGQEMGSQEYGNAYNRFLQQRELQLRALQGLASPGVQATGYGTQLASNMGQQAVNTGANIANTMLGAGQALGQGIEQAGQARASSYMGGQSALQGALGGIGRNAMAAALYGQMQGGGGAPLGGAFGSPFPSSYATTMYG